MLVLACVEAFHVASVAWEVYNMFAAVASTFTVDGIETLDCLIQEAVSSRKV